MHEGARERGVERRSDGTAEQVARRAVAVQAVGDAPDRQTLARMDAMQRHRVLSALQRGAGNAQVATLVAGPRLSRVVQGDVTATSIGPEFAQALTDDELAQQVALVRGRLTSAPDAALQANLAVLEAEVLRRPGAPGRTGGGGGGHAELPAGATPLGVVGAPLAAGMLQPVAPIGPTGPPPGMPPGYTPTGPQSPPGAWQYQQPPTAPRGPGPSPGPGPGVGAGLGTGLAVGAGAIIAAVGVGLAVFLYSSPTAPAWMSEINPLTGGPYRNAEEWDQVRHMSPEAFRQAMARRGGRRYGSMAEQPASGPGGTGGPPPPDECHRAIKILQDYERLAEKLGSQLPASRLAALNTARDAGTITVNDIPAGLRREWPGGVFDGKTLEEIRRMCGMTRSN